MSSEGRTRPELRGPGRTPRGRTCPQRPDRGCALSQAPAGRAEGGGGWPGPAHTSTTPPQPVPLSPALCLHPSLHLSCPLGGHEAHLCPTLKGRVLGPGHTAPPPLLPAGSRPCSPEGPLRPSHTLTRPKGPLPQGAPGAHGPGAKLAPTSGPQMTPTRPRTPPSPTHAPPRPTPLPHSDLISAASKLRF